MIITTKFLGPTNFRPARVKATSRTGSSVIVNWDYELGTDGNHKRAASALLDKGDDTAQEGRETMSCYWDEGGGAVFFPMDGRAVFPL